MTSPKSFQPQQQQQQQPLLPPPYPWGQTGFHPYGSLMQFPMFIPPVSLPQAPNDQPQQPPQATAAQPSEWETYFDERKGKPYYHNRTTGKTTWKMPDELKKAQSAAATAQPTQPQPIKTENYSGSKVWKRVFCDTGAVYYYNADTKEVTWTAPKIAPEEKEQQQPRTSNSPTAEKMVKRAEGNALAAIDAVLGKGGTDNSIGSSSSSSSNNNDSPDTKTNEDDNSDNDNDSNNNNNSSSSSTKEGSDEPLAKRRKKQQYESEEDHREKVKVFQEMLQKVVKSSTSKWDEMLPTLACAEGFGAILDMGERRALFEDHVKARAREEQAEARANARQNAEGFRALFGELSPQFDSTVGFLRFMELAGDDPRFTRLEPHERERYFRDSVEELRRREAREAADVRGGFLAILRDLFPEDVVGRSWAKTLPLWENVKKFLSLDDRYKAISDERLRMSDRRAIFMSYYDGVKTRYLEEKRRRDELEDKERSIRRKYEREKRDREKAMKAFAVKEAEKQALALIAERIKDPGFITKDCLKSLGDDPRWKNKLLTDKSRERLLREHRSALVDARIADYKLLLREQDAKGGITLGTTWEEFSERVGSDPRFVKTPQSCSRKALFVNYRQDLINRALDNLVELLKENRMVSRGLRMDSQQYRNAARILAVKKK